MRDPERPSDAMSFLNFPIARILHMKNLPGVLLAVALATAHSAAATNYHLSPPHTHARLRGRLTFSPNGGTPFNCTVTLGLKTKGIIKFAKVDTPSGCNGLNFGFLPWFIGILNASSGQFGRFGFSSSNGDCNQGAIQFQDNSSGIWTLPAGQCMSGTLTSTPAVTIAP
jgi:hypothetical protein